MTISSLTFPRGGVAKRGATIITGMSDNALPHYQSHSRNWRANHFVYPVISRRAGGLSIGVNLSPNGVCNFNCVYCQVNRSSKRPVQRVDPARLRGELSMMIAMAKDGSLFDDPAFRGVPTDKRSINDIAFSGDGEPTANRVFPDVVELAAALKREAGLDDTRIVLITNACYLTRPRVKGALAVLDANNGEIWAKLDAGTEAHYRKVNRPNFPLQHVVDNIIATAKVRPVVIQSLFMRLDDEPPDEAELRAYLDRLGEITSAGGRIKLVQVYTVARRPAEPFVSPLSREEVDLITERVRRDAGVSAEAFYGIS